MRESREREQIARAREICRTERRARCRRRERHDGCRDCIGSAIVAMGIEELAPKIAAIVAEFAGRCALSDAQTGPRERDDEGRTGQ